MMIYLFFKPLTLEKKEFIDVPLFEVKNFNIYEVDTKGLKTILLGNSSKRYSDRYTVEGIDYTDNSKKFIANMQADNGVYTEESVQLSGNIRYAREDGLTFKCQEANYDKKSSVVSTATPFIAYLGDNVVKGSSLQYNSKKNKIESKNIEAIYQLQESEK